MCTVMILFCFCTAVQSFHAGRVPATGCIQFGKLASGCQGYLCHRVLCCMVLLVAAKTGRERCVK